MPDIPCKCGHIEKVHLKYGGIIGQPDIMCTDCFYKPGLNGHWHYFNPDNLSYIEKLAKQKGLV